MSRTKAVFAALLAALLVPIGASAQNAVITGVVRSETQASIGGALVAIEALELTAVTNDNGSYRMVVPADRVRGQQVTITVSTIGFGAGSAEITINAGAIQQNFELAEEAIALDEVIVTGTAGRQERRAQTATVASINASRVAEVAPVASVANLIQGRTPGVMLRQTTGSSGAGQEIRIRGQASVSLSSDPLVFIDGVLMDSGTEINFGVGNATGSQLNDIKMEDIESIEIVKGPAAATLYGSDASSGVINIITKRGRPNSGFTQSVTLEYGQADPNFSPPDNYARCTGSTAELPGCAGQPDGAVLVDNPLLRESAFGDGRYRNFLWSLRGGGENYGVFLSFGADDEDGTLPNNEYGHMSGRAQFDFVPSEQLRMEFGFWMGRTNRQLPHNDNNIYGWLGGGFLGTPASRGGPNDGWYGANRTAVAIGALESVDRSIRFQPRLSVQYTPFDWFSNRLTVGGDLQRVRAFQFWPKNDDGWFDSAPLNTGQISELRDTEDRITIDYLGNVTAQLMTDLRADFSFGTQILTEVEDETWSQGQGLVTNEVRNVDAAAILSNGGQEYEESRKVGFFGQAAFSIWEKLYIQAGARIDQASVFGSDSDPFVSPKVGVSYVLSDEPYFRNIAGESLITTLKLRGAYGVTPRQPTEGVLATYATDPYATFDQSVEIGVTPENPGNISLKPERSAELELGFDAGLLNDRLGIELTYFNKTTTDLIVEQDLPGSLGFGEDPDVNLGKVRNRGFEIGANARVLTYDNLALELFGSLNTLDNEILDIGGIDPGTGNQRNAVGGPIDAVYDHEILEYDLENNRAMVTFDRVFLGNPQDLPGWETTFSSTLTLFRNLSFYASFDGRGDYYVFDNTAQFRDRQLPRSALAILGEETPGVSKEEYLSKFGPFVAIDPETGEEVTISRNTVGTGYRTNVEFLKLREVSATYRLPRDFASRFLRAQTALINLSVRNLETWTNYSGLDPETGQFLTVPQDRRWNLRMNVTF
jgi:TonB-linked SusC/RagA family outer membrane protein